MNLQVILQSSIIVASVVILLLTTILKVRERMQLKEEVKTPPIWDRVKLAKVLNTAKYNEELYELIGSKSASSFSRTMKVVFPDRPHNMSYLEYGKTMLTDPRLQQAEQPVKSKHVTVEPPMIQPRIRTDDDIWESKQLWKEAGFIERKEWLQNHPDPSLETLENPYAEEHVFKR